MNKNLNNIQIIKYPIISDKATSYLKQNKYSFIVDPNSNKILIKSIIESIFNVKILKINTCHIPKKKKKVGKYKGWKPHYKKAIITLKKGYIIDLFSKY